MRTNRTTAAIVDGINRGLTVKEAAHAHGIAPRSIQNQASKFGVCLPYGGVGPRPDPAKVRQSQAWASTFPTAQK